MKSKLTKAKNTRPIWVVKAGSQMVIDGGAWLVRSWMEQVALLRRDFGIDIIWVTSGAIATAAQRIGFSERKRTLAEKQALSSLGQPMVMELYNLACQSLGFKAAQVLLTAEDLADNSRRENLKQTLFQLIEWHVIPVVNENDAVATDEIQFGDNDQLSALLANQMGAKRLVLLTDVDGLFDFNPKIDPKAKLIKSVKQVTDKILFGLKEQPQSKSGRGGMLSKIMAAERVQNSGIVVNLARGDRPHVLVDIAEGRNPGTEIGQLNNLIASDGHAHQKKKNKGKEPLENSSASKRRNQLRSK